jgi:hypothetical protein
VGPRAGLDNVKKKKFLTLPRLELRPLGCPACSQSVRRLRYPGSITVWYENDIVLYSCRLGTLVLSPSCTFIVYGKKNMKRICHWLTIYTSVKRITFNMYDSLKAKIHWTKQKKIRKEEEEDDRQEG